MGYPDLQDGRPPRSRAGAELPDGPVPGEMPGEGTEGYAPPPVPGADGAPWRDNPPEAPPAYADPANGAPANGSPPRPRPPPRPPPAPPPPRPRPPRPPPPRPPP